MFWSNICFSRSINRFRNWKNTLRFDQIIYLSFVYSLAWFQASCLLIIFHYNSKPRFLSDDRIKVFCYFHEFKRFYFTLSQVHSATINITCILHACTLNALKLWCATLPDEPQHYQAWLDWSFIWIKWQKYCSGIQLWIHSSNGHTVVL